MTPWNFADAHQAVPDGGATLVLLGVGLVGLCILRWVWGRRIGAGRVGEAGAVRPSPPDGKHT